MGATRNLGYIENLISYDGNDNIGIGGAVNVLYKVTINGNTLASGTLNIGTVTNANTDTDKFLVLDTNGTVRFRTGAELASDIGPANLAASTLKHVVKLAETVSKGQAVYVSSADGTNMIVSKASNASEATSSKTLGLVETNGVLNDQVNVITEGLLAGLDTSTANIGDPVWLGTSGNIIFGLANKPYAPAHLVFIGVVTRVQQNNGEIFVKVQNGFEIQELHNVQITSTPTDNQVLTYETATSLYKMKTVDGANVTGYALTKTDDTNVTLTLGGSASTSLLRAASLTLGWTGQLAISRGGTGLSALGTDGQLLRVNSGATALEYWTPTYISAAITSLNGLSGATQTFATGTSGTDFGISSSSTTHTFNLPTASATNRGALSSTDWSTFNGKQAALNGTGFVKISGTTISYDNSTYLTSYTETDTLASVTGRGASTTTAISINSASVDHVTLANRFHFIGSSNFHITNNAYYNAAFKYQTAAVANKITIQSDGNFLFDYAASGTIDNNITWTTVFSVTNAGIATASSFVKSGGTSSQILMADGSVLTAGTNITISGGTISSTGGSSLNGTGFVRMAGTTVSYITGTSSQFVKADGSLDGTGYEPTVTKGNLTSANTAHLTVTGGTGAIIGSGVNLTILPGAIVNSGLGLTTTGNSGAATFSNATLNIPNYTLAGLGGVPTNGTGATGTWGINITGSSASSTDALRIVFNDGPRDLSNRLPNSFTRTVNWDFVTSATIGGTGNYGGVMTFAPWTGTTASTGDSSYQMAFMNESGSNGTGLPGLRLRKGIDTAWGSWYTLLHAGNYNSYSPTLTGTGASGTWGINISGNAATATTASGVAWTNVSGRPTALSSFTNDSGYITANSTPYFGINNNSNTSGNGISLYGTYTGGEMQYGFMFAGTGTYGTYGDVTGDWATYIMMNNSTTRGWIFRRNQTANVASISGAGNATFAGYVSASDVRATIFYDSNNTGYYGDFAGTSRISSLNMGYVGGQVYLNSGGGTLFFNANGEGDIQGYSIGTTMENINGNYTKLTIDWHTGIRIGAASSYGGIRFYNNSVKYYSGSQVFSVAEGDNNVRVTNTLFVNGDVRSPQFRFTNSTNNAYLTGNSDWGFRVVNDNGYIQFGPANGTWAHIYSGQNFYFNQNLYVNGTQVVTNSGTWSINVTGSAGSASSATYLNSSNYIQRSGSSGNYNTDFQNTPAGTVRHLGDDPNITNNPGGTWWFIDNYRHSNSGNYWGTQIAWGWEDNANRLAQRNITGNSFSGWVYYLNSGNYTSYIDAPNKAGTSYYQANTWIQFNGNYGLYWPNNYGGHFYPNDYNSYTQFRINGSKNGYGGIVCSYSAVAGMMYDSGGNGGVYREANGRWYWYHHVGNNCTGISTSSTSSSYRAYVGGALYAEGDLVAFSDVRKKTDIVTIDNALNKVLKLRGVYYTRIDEVEKGRQLGVIAQEINEILPEAVTYAADIDEYGVKYGNIVGILIESIKEQQKQIEELKSQIKNK